MRLALFALTLLLCASAVHAQLVTPTNAYRLVWDYTGTPPHHFDVRYATSGAWTNVGTAREAAVPLFAPGGYTVQVRACLTATQCLAFAALPFTVAVVPAPTPTSAPTWAP
jgi:hypothetical protein